MEDDIGNTLADVSVFLLRDGAIIESKKSSKEGFFIINEPKIGDIIKLSSLDYKSTEVEISKIEDLSFVMYELESFDDIITLSDVKLTNKVVVKKDTISYKADQFLIGNENSTEDLLKKIPGVTVDDDGKVKIQGKEIERIMVDGDDLLRKKYKFLSRGLTPKAVEDVELHLNDEENALLRGMNAENKYAINLKLKKEFKNILFGDIEAGNNFDKRYRINASLMSLKEKNKMYFTSFLNNIGEDVANVNFTGSLNDLMFTNISPTAIFPFVNISNSFTSVDKEKFNFNNNQFFSFNNIYRFSPKTTLKFNSQLVFDKLKFDQQTNQKYFIGDSVQLFKDDFRSSTKVFNTTNAIELKSDFSKKSNYQGFLGISVGKENITTKQIFNDVVTNQQLNNFDINLQQKNVYTFKGKNDSIVSSLSTLFSYQKQPQDYFVDKENTNSIVQNLEIEKFSQTYQYQNRYKNNRMLNVFTSGYRNEDYKLNALITSSIFNLSQNDFRYRLDEIYLSNYFTYENNKLKLGANLAMAYKDFKHIRTKNNFSFNPNTFIKYKINSSDYLELTLNSQLNQIDFNEMVNFYHYTAVNSVNKGLDDLFFYRSNNASLRYNYGDYSNLTSFSIGANYNQTNGSIVNELSFDNNMVYNDLLINHRNSNSITLFGDVDYYLKPIKSSIKLNSAYNFGEGYFLNQSNLEEYKNQQLNLEVSLASGFRGFFNYKLSNQYRYNSIQSFYKNSDFSIKTKLETFFNFNKITLNNVISRTYLSNVDKEIYFFDSDLRYNFSDKLQFSVKGRNLFNEKTYSIFQYNITNEVNSTYNINPRYILFSMKYKF